MINKYFFKLMTFILFSSPLYSMIYNPEKNEYSELKENRFLVHLCKNQDGTYAGYFIDQATQQRNDLHPENVPGLFEAYEERYMKTQLSDEIKSTHPS